ncbi:hypothetical protein LTR85_005600 [Meristemomyces frigidus]|nr:hypothetical protein LTR85_005600 [Meristemomyces frigidus]
MPEPTTTTPVDLALENTRLRAELDECRRLAAKRSSAPADRLDNPHAIELPKATVFRLMDLPKELRLGTYEYLLIPGTITLSYPKKKHDREHDPRYKDITAAPSHSQTQLFLVSNTVKSEALPIYLAENLFTWSPTDFEGLGNPQHANPLFVNGVIYGRPAAFHMRKLSAVFDFRDVDIRRCHTMATYYRKRDGRWDHSAWHASHKFERAESRDYCHQLMVLAMQKYFGGICITIAGGTQALRLLRMDLTNCYCALGCCRMVEVVRDAIKSWQSWHYPPKVLEFSGVRGVEERAMLQALKAPEGRDWEWDVRFK